MIRLLFKAYGFHSSKSHPALVAASKHCSSVIVVAHLSHTAYRLKQYEQVSLLQTGHAHGLSSFDPIDSINLPQVSQI